MSELLNRVWTTLDGTEIRVKDMTRQHAWNAMRMIERNGHAGSYMHQAFKEKLGHVSKQEELKFESINATYNAAQTFKEGK